MRNDGASPDNQRGWLLPGLLQSAMYGVPSAYPFHKKGPCLFKKRRVQTSTVGHRKILHSFSLLEQFQNWPFRAIGLAQMSQS